MKRKRYIIISLALVVLIGIIWIWAFSERPLEDTLPPLIMVDGTIYRQYDTAEELPPDAAEGYITKVILENKMPSENDCANFGDVGMQYWKTDEKIYTQDNNCYIVYQPIEE